MTRLSRKRALFALAPCAAPLPPVAGGLAAGLLGGHYLHKRGGAEGARKMLLFSAAWLFAGGLSWALAPLAPRGLSAEIILTLSRVARYTCTHTSTQRVGAASARAAEGGARPGPVDRTPLCVAVVPCTLLPVGTDTFV